MPRGEHFTREHQQRARKAVSSASCASNGRKGAAVTSEKYGKDYLFSKWRAWKLGKPSMNELVMIGIFARLGVSDYVREWRVGKTLMTIDFYFPSRGKAIEVQGRIHHVFDSDRRQRLDQHKAAMLKDMNIDCLTVEYLEFCEVLKLAERVRLFLSGE